MPRSAGGKALAVIASPRAGNTAAAARDLLAGWAGGGRSAEELWLDGVHVEPIGDCRACLDAGRCSRIDAFDEVMEGVYASDLLVLATPLYWYGPSAQLKLFLDRWSCLLDRNEEAFRGRMRGKRVVLLIAQGEQGFYESAPCLQMLEWTSLYLDMVVAARVVVVGHGRHDYLSDEAQRQAVKAVGEKLAASPTAPDLLPAWFHVPHVPGSPLGGIFRPDRA